MDNLHAQPCGYVDNPVEWVTVVSPFQGLMGDSGVTLSRSLSQS